MRIGEYLRIFFFQYIPVIQIAKGTNPGSKEWNFAWTAASYHLSQGYPSLCSRILKQSMGAKVQVKDPPTETELDQSGDCWELKKKHPRNIHRNFSFTYNFWLWFFQVLVRNDIFRKVHLIRVLRVHHKCCSDSFRSWNLEMQQQKKHCIRILYVIILTYGKNGDVDWKTCWLGPRGQPRCSSVHRELRHSSKWRPVMVWPNSA